MPSKKAKGYGVVRTMREYFMVRPGENRGVVRWRQVRPLTRDEMLPIKESIEKNFFNEDEK